MERAGIEPATSPYYDSFDNYCILDSTYELILANKLDKLNINWCRPKYLNYKDDNNDLRRYHPDFYLNDYNIYLDPKNDYLIKKDKRKIENVISYNNINLKVLSLNDLYSDKLLDIIGINQ